MPIHTSLYSSKSAEHSTPQWLYDLLDGEFHFTLDPCATPDNAKAPEFFTLEDDGLSQDWGGEGEVVFVNPPYSRGAINKWVEKAVHESEAGATVVMLLPNRSSSLWFQYVYQATEIRFIDGRLKFENTGNDWFAPFPSIVVIFKQNHIFWPQIGEPISARGKS